MQCYLNCLKILFFFVSAQSIYSGFREISAKLHSSKLLLLIGILDRTKGNLLDYLFGGVGSSKLENNININLGSQAVPYGPQGNNIRETDMIRKFLLKNVGNEAFVPQSLIDFLLKIAKDDSVEEFLKSHLFNIAADLFTTQQVN